MKIGINLYPLRPRIAGGHEFYVRNLLSAMLKAGPEHSYYIITAPWNHHELDFGEGSCKKILIEGRKSRWDLGWRLRALAGKSHWDIYCCAMELNPDVWFCPMMDLNPRHIRIPSVVTVPDIQYEFYPEFFPAEELKHRQLMVKPSCQQATGVITVSDYSRQSMLERFGLNAGKVYRVYEAAGPEYNRESAKHSWAAASAHYGLKEGYLFYPANNWPHKNHDLLLMALQRLKKRGQNPSLVLCGAEVEASARLKELSAQLGCEAQVRHLGYVDRQFFPGLYFGAGCLVFPSLFEGFGIPLVEAMACGCAIACSNACSIPEVAGDAAVLFDPRSPDAIADALQRILTDGEFRRQLMEKGAEQARRFSWEIAARETLAVFEKVRMEVTSGSGAFIPPQDAVDGYYGDGWAGPRMLVRKVELGRWKSILLEGEVNGNCSPLSIRFWVGRSHLDEVKMESPGPFACKVALPAPQPELSLVDIKVTASGHFVPKKAGINEDTRQLSFLVRNFALVDADGNTLVLQRRR